MKKIIQILIFLCFINFVNAQDTTFYYQAFSEINQMLLNPNQTNFKKAVFSTENAYFDNNLDYNKFCKDIELLKFLSNSLIASRELIYEKDDKKTIEKYASIFTIMSDTVPIQLDTNKIVYHLPFQYDFNDAFGDSAWSNMFVSKLLTSHKGNCHSLPMLYKILCEEMNEKCYLSLAPNHIYVKLWCEKGGWYNTELTCNAFPIDAWLMVSGYVSLQAIQNGVFMDTLSNQQSLALCMLDLAKGYDRKFNNSKPDFVLMCCDSALKYYPNFVNALLLKAETMKKQLEQIMKTQGKTNFQDVLNQPKAKQLFDKMNFLYTKVYQSGYREMPRKMYFDWLLTLQSEKEKYTNTKILPSIINQKCTKK